MSQPEEQSWTLLGLAEALSLVGALGDVAAERSDDGLSTISGQVRVEGRDLRLVIELCADFPAVAPTLRLLSPRRYGLLPHVDSAGSVCVARHDTILLDPERPAQALIELVVRARGVLADGLSGRSITDVQEEFEAYWRQQPSARAVNGHVSPLGHVRVLQVQKQSQHNHTPIMVTDALSVYQAYHAQQPWCGDIRNDGLFVPLPPGALLQPPLPGEVWQDRDYRDRVLTLVDPQTRGAIERNIRRWHGEHTVVFSLPRRHGGHTLFGVWFQGVTSAHPLDPRGRASRATPLVIRRRDWDFLRPRGGAEVGLHQRRVVVIGCGSVGGYIAAELARAGVGHLELVDGDTLEAENTFRHHLSRSFIGINKATALAADLRDRVPYLYVRAHTKRVEKLTAADLDWSQFDLCVFATGSAGMELEFNRRMFSGAAPEVAIHSWLEPLGIGGHALLTLPRARAFGCLRCLYTGADGEWVPARTSLADPRAETDVDLSGCGSRFTPFANLDAVRTAALTVELALQSFRVAPEAPQLRTWRGSDEPLRRAGIDTTRGYRLSDSERAAGVWAQPLCPICRGGD